MTVYLHFPDNSALLAELKSVSQNQPQGCFLLLLRSSGPWPATGDMRCGLRLGPCCQSLSRPLASARWQTNG